MHSRVAHVCACTRDRKGGRRYQRAKRSSTSLLCMGPTYLRAPFTERELTRFTIGFDAASHLTSGLRTSRRRYGTAC
jgi:hypothetical protein